MKQHVNLVWCENATNIDGDYVLFLVPTLVNDCRAEERPRFWHACHAIDICIFLTKEIMLRH